MALPADLSSVVVTGTFKDATGMPLPGKVTFTPSTTLSDATGKVTIRPSGRSYWLAAGSFTSDPLVATDNADIEPAGWTYTVLVEIADAIPYSFSCLLPGSPSPVDLSAVQPVIPQPAVISFIPSTGGAVTGTLSLGGSPPLQIAAGATPGAVLTSDGAGNVTWSPGPLSAKDSVQAATAAALPSNTYAAGALTATANGALTVDGIAVAAGSRVLVQNEATAANNGIYLVTQAGGAGTKYILTRAPDMSAAAEIPGAFAYAEQGTANAGAGFIVQGAGPFTIGTTPISWVQFSGAGGITAGTGLARAGNTVSLAVPVSPSSGGTGQTTLQAALNAMAASVTSGQFLRGNGTNVVLGAIQAADVPTLNQNTTGNAATASIAGNVSGTVAIPNGGTGVGTAAGALAALGALPVAGGTMTGAITLPANPAASLQAAPKQYVDAETTRATAAEALAAQKATANTFTADQYFESGRPWFDVIAFGADPTGTADSTTAIQTAINTALGLRTDTGVSMSGFTVTDPAAVSGDVGKYVNSPNYPAIVTYAVGVTASNPVMQVTGVSSAPFVANQPVVLTGASAPAGFTSGTTYFILSPSQVGTTFSFSLSATSGGSAITPTSTGTTVTVAATTGGCSLITAVTSSPAGYTVATPAAASLAGQVVAIGSGSSVTARTPSGPVFIPGGTYKVSSDILIQSVFGFHLMTAGQNVTTLKATGGGFTTAILNIDGSLDGRYGGLQIRGDGTEGTGGVASSGVPCAVNLTWTTSANRSTSANTLEQFRVRALMFVTGISLAGIGTRQLDGTQLQDIVVSGSQPLGGWSASARIDTGVCGTSTVTPNTVTDTAAASGDFGMLISGPGIPANAKITAVTPGTGYTISGTGATATASGVTFTVGTGLWQAGFQFGNGSQGNIYDEVMYGCSAAGCYAGYNVNLSSIALFSAQPANNGTDFVLIPSAQCTIENVQSQNSRQFITASTSGSVDPVSFRDCEYSGYTGTGFNSTWISAGTLYGSLILENLSHTGAIASPVIALGSANYHAQFTLINVSQKAPPSSGIVVTNNAAVIAINYSDTTAGTGTLAVLYPFYAVNAGVLYQQGLASARPAASTFGELFYYATDTGALSHSSGSSWTSFTATAPTAPDIQWITATGSTTWTKPSGAVTVQSLLFGPGAGGGSGRRGAAGTIRGGGGGGGGGAVSQKQFVASDLPSTVTVTVSAGTAGGAAVTADNTNGNGGSSGSATSFGSFLTAAPGNPGAGGTATGGNAGAGGVAGTTPGGPGAAASTTGLAGANAALAAGGAGGSSGGGISAADVAANGAIGNNSCLGVGTQGGASNSAAGVVDTTSPTSGAQSSIKGALGVAGGSGAASITTAAQAAAASVGIAAGGSGGGASLNGNNSGAGNAGGPGAALIISYFQ